MTQLIPKDQVRFANGDPHIHFDECYSCFKDHGLLYRLVDLERQQWAFYNDTTDTIISVYARFGTGSHVKPLQRTKIAFIPRADGTIDEACEQEATLVVEPGFTELFIEGKPNGFSLDFQSEAAPEQNPVYLNGQPAVAYDKVYKCFKNNGNGLLFRLVDEHSKTWSFYNDTREFTMKIKVIFAERAEVTPLGKTVDAGAPEDSPSGAVLTLEVAPGMTEPFIQGIPVTYKLSFAAEPVNVVPPGDEVHYENGQPDLSIIPVINHAYKCFKDHGNGLLFRLVDDHNKIWAFYNDTTVYIMTVTVRFPAGSDFAPAPGVHTTSDAERPGGIVAVVQVPPLTTVPFLVGQPLHYDLSFTANAAPDPQATIVPNFLNGGPNASVMEYQEVHKCFKDHGNGLVFRLVNVHQHRWAFYNDTDNIVATIKVSFSSDADVKALGKTKVESDPEMGIVYTLQLPPLATELFVEGRISTFTTKFTATPV